MGEAPERMWIDAVTGLAYSAALPGRHDLTEYLRADLAATPLARMVGILQRLRGLSDMDATLMAATLVAIECEADAVLREMEETRNG